VPISKLACAQQTHGFTESVIREMTRLCARHGGVNLSQGFPDFPSSQSVKDAACVAIHDDVNQYAVTGGAPEMRHAVSREFTRRYGVPVDPGDEVIVFEPFYENYGPDAILSGATPRYVTLREPRGCPNGC